MQHYETLYLRLAMTSLHQKILLGYYLIGSLILLLALFVWSELQVIETQIFLGERIADFFEVTLEIRRFEKNYFLHGQTTDLAQHAEYLARAQHLLLVNQDDFATLITSPTLHALHTNLLTYQEFMQKYAKQPQDALAQHLRTLGKQIVTIAEKLSIMEKQILQTSLQRHRQRFMVFISVLILLIIWIGQNLSQRVVQPLRALEQNMEVIARGKRDKIDLPFMDREIVSLTRAFNGMLHDLEMRQKHLIRSEKLASLGTLLAGVAHELNNPLSNISSSAQILLEELSVLDQDGQRELIHQIDEQTLRARNIVHSLLNFVREREFKKELFNCQDWLTETLRFLKGQIPTQVTFHRDIPADLTILADRQRLQQALLNLLKNAVEAIEGPGEVQVTARQGYLPSHLLPQQTAELLTQRGDNCLEVVDLSIGDNGPGIPANLLPRIFDPFFTTKGIGSGSGLGLSIVHEIIEEHNGYIWVTSTPRLDTTFLIRLPVLVT